MSHGVLEKTVCEECGVDVRENTYYCYNCGTRIAEAEPKVDAVKENNPKSADVALEPVEKPDLDSASALGKINTKGREALEDLAERIRLDDKADDGEAIARAAAKRKQSRSAKRKGIEYVWEPVNDPPDRFMLILVGFIVLLSTVAVVMTVIWK